MEEYIFHANFNPIALDLGFFNIKWYSLAYITGFIVWLIYTKKLIERYSIKFKPTFVDDLFLYTFLGVIIGGRLGYILFYNLSYYIANPLDALYLWHGGMSFHGAIIAILIAIYIFAKKHNYSVLKVLDVSLVYAPVGVFFGRIANFINGELWGRETDGSWGVIFNASNSMNPRHPSQLYEAALEGVLLFLVFMYFVHKKNALKKTGFITGVGAIVYGSSRIIVEFFRMPDEQVGYILSYLTMGQILSLPMVLIGLYFVYNSCKKV